MMENNILLSLEITAVGMGLVFGAIVALWGLMTLMTAVIKERPHKDSESASAPAPDRDFKARAAAAAVIIALAEQETSTAHPLPLPPTALVSAWQLGLRSRQLVEKGSHR